LPRAVPVFAKSGYAHTARNVHGSPTSAARVVVNLHAHQSPAFHRHNGLLPAANLVLRHCRQRFPPQKLRSAQTNHAASITAPKDVNTRLSSGFLFVLVACSSYYINLILKAFVLDYLLVLQ
jgi:hypothetical protein